jgi:ESCRT-II complex subunit VPS36
VQSLNAKLSTTAPSTTGTQDEESETRTFLRSSLVQLGLPVPAITKDAKTMRDEREYLEALAVEFGGVLTGVEGKGLMTGKEGKGVLGMDEAWVVWNRARGVCESFSSDLNPI